MSKCFTLCELSTLKSYFFIEDKWREIKDMNNFILNPFPIQWDPCVFPSYTGNLLDKKNDRREVPRLKFS